MAYDQTYYGESSGSSVFASSPDAPPEETAFDAVNATMDRSRLLATRVQALADRLVGPIPQPVNSAEGRSGPGAVLPALRNTATMTRIDVEDALNALERIERALP